MQRGSVQLLILTVILVITVVTGAVVLKNFKTGQPVQLNPQSQKETEKTQVYSIPELGLEFEYDKNLIIKTDTEEEFNLRGNGDYRKNFKGYVGYEPAKVKGAVAVLNKDEKFETNPFSVWIFENDNNLTIEQFFQNYWYYPFVWGVFDYTSKGHIALDREATVSGQQAKYKVIAYQPGNPKFIYVSKNQKMYLFRVIGETGEKILNTLQFN